MSGTAKTSALAADLCRVTVVAPTGRADIAIPRSLTVAELLPVLVKGCRLAGGPQPGRAGNAPGTTGSWALQRLGEPVFDEDATLAQVDLHDGEVLHLRQQGARIPPIAFDDIVDGISSTVRERTDVWLPRHSRWFLTAAAGLIAVAGLVPLLQSGQPALRCALAGATAIVMLVAAAMLSRAAGDRSAAATLGAVGVAFAGLAGVYLPAAVTGDGFAAEGGASAAVLAAGAAASCAAALAGAGVGSANSLFSCLGGIAGLTTVLGLLLVWPGLSVAGAAGLVTALVYLLSVMMPNLVARIARLRVPELPTNAVELGKDIDPIPQQQLAAKANTADRYLTALALAVAVACIAGFALLATSTGVMAYVLAAVIATGLLLRTRVFVAIWQRLSIAVAGLVGMVLVAAGGISRLPIWPRCAATVLLVIVAIVLASIAGRAGERKWSPYLGRAADIAETLTAVVVLPLAVGVAGGYAFAQGLAG